MTDFASRVATEITFLENAVCLPDEFSPLQFALNNTPERRALDISREISMEHLLTSGV